MEPEPPIEDGVIFCSFREIGIILPSKRYYKCVKPDVCCDTGCCNEQSYKFGTVWQYWQVVLLIVLGVVFVSIVRYCCWLCKRKHTTLAALNNSRPSSMTLPLPPTPPSNLNHRPVSYPNNTLPPTRMRPVIGGRGASCHNIRNASSVFSLGGPNSSPYERELNHLMSSAADEDNAIERMDDHLTEALVHRDRYGLNSLAGVRTPMGLQWSGPNGCRRTIVPGVGARIGREAGEISGGLTEDERLELGIRAIGGNTELTNELPSRRDRTSSNNSAENGDLALLTHLMALDIIYHSDSNNNNIPPISGATEKPPDYEQCLHLSNTVKLTDEIQPPTYDDIFHHALLTSTIPVHDYNCQTNNNNDTVVYMVDVTGNVTSVTDVNNCHQHTNGNVSV